MTWIEEHKNTIIRGDALTVLKTWPDECIDMVFTSPPYYGLRDYEDKEQIGLEKTLDEYLIKMLAVMAECKRVLKKTGTMWWNHGDSYNGTKVGDTETRKNPKVVASSFRKGKQPMSEKSLLFQNYRLAIRMIDEQQWIARNVIIWHKPNCMPSSVKDRFTVDYEPVFFFTKSKKYFFEQQFEPYTEPMNRWGGDELKAQCKSEWDEGTGQDTYRDRNMRPNSLGRNKRCVWKIPTHPYPEAHFATFPSKLIVTPILAGCPKGGIVLDPFMGSGTTAYVARELGRQFVGIELNESYIKLAYNRLAQQKIL